MHIGEVLAIWGTFILIFSVIGFILYFLISFDTYKIASNNEQYSIKDPWLACIPIGNLYIMAKLIESLKINFFEDPKLQVTFPTVTIVGPIVNLKPASIFVTIYVLLSLFAICKLYERYKAKKTILYTILSIIFPFMSPVLIFMVRK